MQDHEENQVSLVKLEHLDSVVNKDLRVRKVNQGPLDNVVRMANPVHQDHVATKEHLDQMVSSMRTYVFSLLVTLYVTVASHNATYSSQVNQVEMVTQDKEESLDPVDHRVSPDLRVHLARGENRDQLGHVENLENLVRIYSSLTDQMTIVNYYGKREYFCLHDIFGETCF